jgi:FHA domain
MLLLERMRTDANRQADCPDFYLIPGRTYTVGRQEGEVDVVLLNDKSISRQHATITVFVGATTPSVTVTGMFA